MRVDEADELHALVVAEHKELTDLGKWYRKMSNVLTFGRLDVLLEMHQEMNLADLRTLNKAVAWRHGNTHELSRPMALDCGKSQRFVGIASTPQEWALGLSAKICNMAMAEAGAPLTLFTMATGPVLDALLTVQLGNKQLHQFIRCMGKSSPDWVTYPSQVLGMARMVYHSMGSEELSDMIDHVS